ncbi:MAG: hypothetical protein P4L50_20800 [Anaerolineaceae bacterium]|nr:hypothetical protein [Anaerolineaceae bacterium]
MKELTGDNVPEVVFESHYRFSVYTCIQGQYILGLDFPSNDDYPLQKTAFVDLNKDNIPEIIVAANDHVAVVPGIYMAIFRWNGSNFQNLSATEDEFDNGSVPENAFSFNEAFNYQILDVDKNGTLDLAIREEIIGTHAEEVIYGPWRIDTHVISWNGSQFVLLPDKLDPPVYRFQAVQDGDRALYRGDFKEALTFYEQALNDHKLKGWSQAKFKQMQAAVEALGAGIPTPTAFPDDSGDYPTLAAYARFHILLIHAIQGNFDQASSEYQSLQNDYPADRPGFAFVQLAQTFWEEYQKTNSLGMACEQARNFAADHPDQIISQIDHTWHGDQTPGYSEYPSIDIEKFICPVE